MVTLTQESTLPAQMYASLLVNASSIPSLDLAGVGVRDAVVLTIAEALAHSSVPAGFDPANVEELVDEALHHATAADTMASMFTARARTIKSAEHLRDAILLLVLTSPEHTMNDADRLFHMFCASGGVSNEMTYQVEAAACVFLAKSLRTFARLVTDIPDHLTHIVEMSVDAKAIPAVLERILRGMY